MTTFAIGDIQGCYDEFRALLKLINFKPAQDRLWLCGDLINRGPKSLDVLRYCQDLPQLTIVLGNHDLYFLAVLAGLEGLEADATIQPILESRDRDELGAWLRQQPLVHYDQELNAAMVHAGLVPQWNVVEAQNYAEEVSQILRGANYLDLLRNMYGDQPANWSEQLQGYDRYRFIINCCTRLRYCEANGAMNLTAKGPIASAPSNLIPWFKMPNARWRGVSIVCGHWSALMGQTDVPDLFALDTGCAWGGQLTALRLEDKVRYNVACPVYAKF